MDLVELWANFLCWIEHHPGLASWGQLIGSMLALGIAIAIPWRQERLRRAEAAQRRKILKLAIVKIARASEDAIKKLSDTVSLINGKANAFPDAEYRAVEAHLNALHGIDLTQFPNEEMLVPFFYLKAQLEEGLSRARSIKERPTPIDLGKVTLEGIENLGSLMSLSAAAQEVCSASRDLAYASSQGA